MISDLPAFAGITLGVLLAVVYPLVVGRIRNTFDVANPFIDALKKYGLLFVFSLITAIIILATYRDAIPTGEVSLYKGIAIGFGWESAVEKILLAARRPADPPDPAAGLGS